MIRSDAGMVIYLFSSYPRGPISAGRQSSMIEHMFDYTMLIMFCSVVVSSAFTLLTVRRFPDLISGMTFRSLSVTCPACQVYTV